MAPIPYVVQRRRMLYLRVRIPNDIVPLARRTHLVRSLRTADPRRARSEAARLLAAVHDAWETMRRDVIKIAGRVLDELSIDDIPTLRPEDVEALSPDEQALVWARLELLLGREEVEVERRATFNARMEAQTDQARALMAGLREKRVARQTMAFCETLLLLARQGAARQPAPTGAPEKPQSPKAGEPWNSFADRFFADRPSIGASARISHDQAFRELATVIGAKPIGEVTKADIKAFADYLRDKPINRGGRTRLTRDSIVKSLQHIRSLFGWAAEAGVVQANPAEGVKPRTETKEERDGAPRRRAMTTAELTILFSAPLFVGCVGRGRLTKPGKQVFRDERWWFWLLALLTGARVEEIASAPSKLVDLDGVTCVDYRHATKTGAGPRLVPVLPELRRLGLIEWCDMQARRGRGLVEGPNAPGDWSKWTNRYLDEIGLDDPLLVTYSLRHNFRQQLRASGISDELMNKVFGHEGDSIGAGYGRDLSPGEARLFVEKVKAPIPLEHLYTFPLGASRQRTT